MEEQPPRGVDLNDFLKTETNEFTLGIYDGRRVAVKCWGKEHGKIRILALHGWLDNSATWDTLAPLLVSSTQHSIRIVAMDFIGHGLSSHDPHSSSYLSAERVLEVLAVADALHWSSFVLMGHSMGGAIATLVAGAVPSRVEKLILIDALGPFRMKNLKAAESLAIAAKERPILLKRQRKIYPNFAAALARYMENNPKILKKSAELIVKRGTEEVLVGGEGENSERGICYLHDHRLVGTQIMYYSEKEVLFFCERIEAPTLALFAKNQGRNEFEETPQGKTFVSVVNARAKRVKNMQLEFVNGEHHFHLDAPELVYKRILSFLDQPVAKLNSKL